jgi:hypothetical protein
MQRFNPYLPTINIFDATFVSLALESKDNT